MDINVFNCLFALAVQEIFLRKRNSGFLSHHHCIHFEYVVRRILDCPPGAVVMIMLP